MKYIQRMDGEEWEIKVKEVTRWSCCDCGLVHDIVFVNGRGVVIVAARVNKRATAAKRRNVRLQKNCAKIALKSAGIPVKKKPNPVKGYNPDGH